VRQKQVATRSISL